MKFIIGFKFNSLPLLVLLMGWYRGSLYPTGNLGMIGKPPSWVRHYNFRCSEHITITDDFLMVMDLAVFIFVLCVPISMYQIKVVFDSMIHIALLSETRHVELTWALWWACRFGSIDGDDDALAAMNPWRWGELGSDFHQCGRTKQERVLAPAAVAAWTVTEKLTKVGQTHSVAPKGMDVQLETTHEMSVDWNYLSLFYPFLRRANSELLGFVASILELKEDQAISGIWSRWQSYARPNL